MISVTMKHLAIVLLLKFCGTALSFCIFYSEVMTVKLTMCQTSRISLSVSSVDHFILAAGIVCVDRCKSPVKGLSLSRGDQSTRLRGDSAHVRLAMMDGRGG